MKASRLKQMRKNILDYRWLLREYNKAAVKLQKYIKMAELEHSSIPLKYTIIEQNVTVAKLKVRKLKRRLKHLKDRLIWLS